MRVSIVTCACNQGAFVEEAIASVVGQDYEDIEYIVIDAMSTDETPAIIERYRDRITRVIREPDAGPADGLNKGFAQATGDVFAYVNADDALLPGAVGRAIEAFRQTPEVDVIYGHGHIVDQRGKVMRRFRSSVFDVWRFAHGAAVIMQQATFIKGDAFREVGGFNTEARVFWDAELLLDLVLAGKTMRRVDEYWGIFRIHDESLTGQDWNGSVELRDAGRAMMDHLLVKALRRPRRQRDNLVALAARAQKWASDPVGLWWRVSDLVRQQELPHEARSIRPPRGRRLDTGSERAGAVRRS